MLYTMVLFILMLIVARLTYLAGGYIMAKMAKDTHLNHYGHTTKSHKHQKAVTTW